MILVWVKLKGMFVWFPSQELDLLESDGKVFKMMGPALIQQDVGEATATVQKRIQYITGEMWVDQLTRWRQFDKFFNTHFS